MLVGDPNRLTSIGITQSSTAGVNSRLSQEMSFTDAVQSFSNASNGAVDPNFGDKLLSQVTVTRESGHLQVGMNESFLVATEREVFQSIKQVVMDKMNLVSTALGMDLEGRAAKIAVSALKDIDDGEKQVMDEFKGKPMPAAISQILAGYQSLRSMVSTRLKQIQAKNAAQSQGIQQQSLGNKASIQTPEAEDGSNLSKSIATGSSKSQLTQINQYISKAKQLIIRAKSSADGAKSYLLQALEVIDKAEALGVIASGDDSDGGRPVNTTMDADQIAGAKSLQTVRTLKNLLESVLSGQASLKHVISEESKQAS